jgi:hypothetical protein
MKTTVINTSKELTAYSDFPPEAKMANFMHNTEMHRWTLYLFLISNSEHIDHQIWFNNLCNFNKKCSKTIPSIFIEGFFKTNNIIKQEDVNSYSKTGIIIFKKNLKIRPSVQSSFK